MKSLWHIALSLLERNQPCAMVEVVTAEGSTPREVGALMLVTANGFHGSIGGGTLEWHAMAEAQSLLGKSAKRSLVKSLGPDLGQCCGGRVTLAFHALTQADVAEVKSRAFDVQNEAPHLHLWGAGHVGRALVMALAPLPFTITWWDVRENAFPPLVPENVTCRLGAPRDMTTAGLVLVMTHSHALDFEVVDFALRNARFSHVGLIGSETKKVRFIKHLQEAGHTPETLGRLTCPIGSKIISSKHPSAIAASVAVQLLEWQEVLKTQGILAPVYPSSAKA